MQKQFGIHGLQNLPMNVKEMTIGEHNKLFQRSSYYTVCRGEHLVYYIDKILERIDGFNNQLMTISEGHNEDVSGKACTTIQEAVKQFRSSVQFEINKYLEDRYKKYPWGYKALYFFNDKGASNYPTEEEWNKEKALLLELSEAFSSDEKCIKWIKEKSPKNDMEEHLKTKIQVPMPQLQEGDIVYAVYMANQAELAEYQKLFYIDTYEVQYLNVGRYGRNSINLVDNHYNVELRVKDKEDNHSSYIVNVECYYEKDGTMSWKHGNSNLSIFTTREEAESYIESIKSMQMVG